VVRLETEAKWYIQALIKEKRIALVWSSVNDYENNDNPSPEKYERIVVWKDLATEQCAMNDVILQKAIALTQRHLRAKDALHVASAIFTQCDYFITTDKKILNKNIPEVAVVNPVAFVEEYVYAQ
jgi:predicted nucleic acid-binding protein